MVDIGKKFLKAMGIDPDFIEKSTKEFNHVHQMLMELFPEEHEPIHKHALTSLDTRMPETYREMGVNGSCVYNLISFKYIEKFGMDAYKLHVAKHMGDNLADVKAR
jgi:hypothetical protein